MNGGDGWNEARGSGGGDGGTEGGVQPTLLNSPAATTSAVVLFQLDTGWWGGSVNAFTLPTETQPLIHLLEVGWWGRHAGGNGSTAAVARGGVDELLDTRWWGSSLSGSRGSQASIPSGGTAQHAGQPSTRPWLDWLVLVLTAGRGWLSWLFLSASGGGSSTSGGTRASRSANGERPSRRRQTAKPAPSSQPRTSGVADAPPLRLPRAPSLTKLLHQQHNSSSTGQLAPRSSEAAALPVGKPSRFQERRQAWRQR